MALWIQPCNHHAALEIFVASLANEMQLMLEILADGIYPL